MTRKGGPRAAPGAPVLVLGDPDEARREEVLRGGALVVRSRQGLRAADRLLIDGLPAAAPGRLLCALDPEAVVARAARALWGSAAAVTCWHLDAHQAARARAALARDGALAGDAPVELVCGTDLPGVTAPGEPEAAARAPFDLVALPLPRQQEAILGRELVEEAQAALAPGGRLLAATDDPKGTWAKRILRDVTGNATVVVAERRKGLCLAARRTKARAEVRDHRHVLPVTLRGRPLRLESRPGVFGHARLDDGTRALAEAVTVAPGEVVLDLGCGYGPLGLALAPEVAEGGGRVVLVDANARAVACAGRNAAANGITNATALLRADLEDLGLVGGPEGPAADLVVANPPYFSNWRIAGRFVEVAAATLRPGGRLVLVAKAAREHADLLTAAFEDVRVELTPRGHGLIQGRRRRDAAAARA